MYTIGIDWSITSPAITVLDENGEILHIFHIDKKKTNPPPPFTPILYPIYKTNTERFIKLATLYTYVIRPYINEAIIGIEGYSFAAKGLVFNIAESTGIFKASLYKYTDELQVIPSPQWKKANGLKGNSKKEPVVELFLDKTGIDIYNIFHVKEDTKNLGCISDIADSWAIARYLYNTSKGVKT